MFGFAISPVVPQAVCIKNHSGNFDARDSIILLWNEVPWRAVLPRPVAFIVRLSSDVGAILASVTIRLDHFANYFVVHFVMDGGNLEALALTELNRVGVVSECAIDRVFGAIVFVTVTVTVIRTHSGGSLKLPQLVVLLAWFRWCDLCGWRSLLGWL